jgi:hypothetical protein
MNAQEQATKKWLLSRLRSARCGVSLVLSYIDDIGKDLAADRIDNEQRRTRSRRDRRDAPALSQQFPAASA